MTLQYKTYPADFIVEEQLGFEADGEGEHVLITVTKTGLSTDQLIGQLIKHPLLQAQDFKKRDVAYSGLKDKFALTTQTLCIPWPIKSSLEPVEALISLGEQVMPLPEHLQDKPDAFSASWQVIRATRHQKKLKRGVHQANRFTITLRNSEGSLDEKTDEKSSAWQLALKDQIEALEQTGFANFFGEQRFGQDNLNKAKALFARPKKIKRFEQSMLISSVRSFLFNAYLQKRIEQGNWLSALKGDCFGLEGSHSFFDTANDAWSDDYEAELNARIQAQDISPMGPLWDGRSDVFSSDAQALWLSVIDEHDDDDILSAGLQHFRSNMAHRALRVFPQQVSLNFLDENTAVLAFSLVRGSFATALLAELGAVSAK